MGTCKLRASVQVDSSKRQGSNAGAQGFRAPGGMRVSVGSNARAAGLRTDTSTCAGDGRGCFTWAPPGGTRRMPGAQGPPPPPQAPPCRVVARGPRATRLPSSCGQAHVPATSTSCASSRAATASTNTATPTRNTPASRTALMVGLRSGPLDKVTLEDVQA